MDLKRERERERERKGGWNNHIEDWRCIGFFFGIGGGWRVKD